jgi:hypothetical protein
VKRLATLVGCTEGQAYTLVIGAVLAVALTVTGLPPALRHVTTAAVAAPKTSPIPGYTDTATLAESTTTPAHELPLSAPQLPPSPGLEGSSVAAATPRSSPASSTTTSPDDSPATTVGTTPATSEGSASGRLTITTGAYARAVGGTTGVPQGGLPVGARAGQEDARVYLRLAGLGSRLRIGVHADTTSTVLADRASIAACRVTVSDWKLDNGSSLASAPPIDTGSCVAGTIGPESTWLFELQSFGDVTDSRGIALVAVLTPGTTFQVTFASTPR